MSLTLADFIQTLGRPQATQIMGRVLGGPQDVVNRQQGERTFGGHLDVDIRRQVDRGPQDIHNHQQSSMIVDSRTGTSMNMPHCH